MPTHDRIVRCAIYTRKSSEEGLEQAFSSLDAQREACAAFIASQRHEGWLAIDTLYDDGGFSGGTLERPAVKRLLADIAAARIDVVVVYKIDRLTRSLMDFARIVEVFDARSVSFVSVTQQFNTTTSMGRLTLNVLLSFAQFEREVTGERIRDKIAASKQKGMWMGGHAPLGYDPVGRKLVVNEEEAETVRLIFDRYLELGSVRRLMEDLHRRGVSSKKRISASGRTLGGRLIDRGALYHILQNRTYLGETVHKGNAYPGEHDAIIDQDLWNRVQEKLAANAAIRTSRSNARESSLLVGLVFDQAGRRLTPSHATKAGRRYRYYVSKPDAGSSKADGQLTSTRIPAGELETAVKGAIAQLLLDQNRICALAGDLDLESMMLKSVLARAKKFAETLSHSGPAEIAELLRDLIARITIGRSSLDIEVRTAGLHRNLIDVPNKKPASGAARPDASIKLNVPCSLRRAGMEMRLVVASGTESGRVPDPVLVRAIVLAHRWFRQLLSGELTSITDLANHTGFARSFVSRRLGLAFLAPGIVEAILDGRQPSSVTIEDLCKAVETSPLWHRQQVLLGI